MEINKRRKGTTVLDVQSGNFIRRLAEFFKEKDLIKVPQWAYLVKCSHGNELPPLDANNWIFHKAAAICRRLYISQKITVGVGHLKRHFGMKKRNGVKPPKHITAGGKIIREILKQLKKANYVENYAIKDSHVTHGLLLTRQGRTELDKIASKLRGPK